MGYRCCDVSRGVAHELSFLSEWLELNLFPQERKLRHNYIRTADNNDLLNAILSMLSYFQRIQSQQWQSERTVGESETQISRLLSPPSPQ